MFLKTLWQWRHCRGYDKALYPSWCMDFDLEHNVVALDPGPGACLAEFLYCGVLTMPDIGYDEFLQREFWKQEDSSISRQEDREPFEPSEEPDYDSNASGEVGDPQ